MEDNGGESGEEAEPTKKKSRKEKK